ncbi:hypothetical protein NEF87_002366 [Candidatus Lokiarchaeum ossiferum]|uniref:CDP-alcohol phosphatidyltransferase n=1 Tax=Candidatus Lokiarchaeum ossiferum TaxID=2951803 RepID=A0ABY6HU36_9ARCH|nr:hypothetical protein NEF87_002366 [Candidatus Lokiarchaeum sp. B-35]
MNSIIETINIEYKKGSKQNGEVLNEYFYRPLAFPFVMIAKKLKLTPNAISVIGFITTIISGILIATGNFLSAAIMLFAGHVLDCTDGSLARNLKKYTKFGAIFDAACDTLGFVFVVVGLMIFESAESGWMVLLYGIVIGLSLGLQVLAYDHFRARYVKGLQTTNRKTYEIFCFPEEDENSALEKKKLNFFEYLGDLVEKFYTAIAPIPKLSIPPQIPTEDKIKIRNEYEKIYKEAFSLMHKLWSLVGGAVLKTLCITLMVIGRADLIWIAVIGGLNCILLLLIILQNIVAYLFRIRMRDLFGMNVTALFNPFTGKPISI